MIKNMLKISNIIQEADFLKEKSLTYHLIKVFAKEQKGTKKERDILRKIKNSLHDYIYIEIIYILTHKIIEDVKKAKHLYFQIIHHRDSLAKKLKRKVGIEISALDYLYNINPMLEDPVIIENSKLLDFAHYTIVDEVTGLLDRSVFDMDLATAVARSKRYKRPLSVLFCDIDDFKKINDTYGHVVGDCFLEKISHAMKKQLRASDKIFRYGGDEFTCLLPETDLASAGIVAEKICNKISQMKITQEDIDHTLTASLSIGCAQLGINDIHDSRSLIAVADHMMYKAKKKGKNQSCSFSDKKKNQKKASSATTVKQTKQRHILAGQTISSGFAQGKAFIYKDIFSRDLLSYSIEKEEIDKEMQRINDALSQVSKELHKTKITVKSDIDKQHAAIFEVHKQILTDEQLIQNLKSEIKNELINAEQVVKNVFRKWSNQFGTSENEMVKNKADDIDDLCRKILRFLLGYEKSILQKIPKGSIVVAKRLLPSDTVHLKRKNVNGIIVEEGSSNSHSAILARALGIPAICNIQPSIKLIKKGDVLLIDGESGTVIIHPTKDDRQKVELKINSQTKIKNKALRNVKKPVKTRNGLKVTVSANASSIEDFKTAEKHGCNRIGLMRIERLYLSSKRLPDEEYLYKSTTRILKNAGQKETTIRLLDIGGDKKLPYLDMVNELSPALGLRGVRLLLKHENLLRTQLRVFYRLSKEFSTKILIPMITFSKEVKKVREIAQECKKELTDKRKMILKDIPIGAMIETPAAVMNIREIAKVSDFLSIGTNDLIQYTMVAGRENLSVDDYYKEGTGMIISTIKKITNVAKQYHIECSVCGEIAGDVNWTQKLLTAGVRSFSASPHCIPLLKEKIRNLTLS